MCLHERDMVEKRFPDDVLEMILLRLPLRTKLCCRCVCQSWNILLSSSIGLLNYSTNMCSSPSASKPSFLLTTKGPSLCVLDPVSNSWGALPQPVCSVGDTIIAAGGDLVCIGNQISQCRSLTVCNLLTGVATSLPPMLKVGLLHKLAMATDEHTNTFVIVVTGEDSSEFRGRHKYRLLTEVYDSVAGSWRKAKDALPEAKFGADPGVWWNGLYYCITEMPYGIVAFSVGEGQWFDFQVEMPDDLVSPSLVSCRGMLLMVGTICSFHTFACGISEASKYTKLSVQEEPYLYTSRTVCIWSFCCTKRVWQLLDWIPENFGQSDVLLHCTSRAPLVCAGVGDFICITSYISRSPLLYNVANRAWSRASADPLFPQNRDPHLLAFSYKPALLSSQREG